MNKKLIIPAIVAVLLASGAPAFAQDHERHDEREANRHEEQNHDQNWHEERHEEGERGAGPRHDMRRGARLPEDYRSKQYVVDDWRGHHLRQPPRGYHWVQTGGDYVLAAVATGIIADILLNN